MVTFVEEIDQSTLSSGIFTLKNGTTDINCSISYSDKVATFTPSSLSDNTTFTAAIKSGIKDLAGNTIADDYSWSFKTIDQFPVPDTGQIASYTATFGEDSDYLYNPPSYTDNGDGTVTDNVTGLIWQQSDDDTARFWLEANEYCKSLSLGGFTDWQIPQPKEYISIIDFSTSNPSINQSFFPGTNSDYWSTSTNENQSGTELSWQISFAVASIGAAHGNTQEYLVRCVRRNQNIDLWGFNLANIGESTSYHFNTGLTWQKETSENRQSWEEALDYCENLDLDNYSDWRLPNIRELVSIIEFGNENPAVNTEMFPNTELTGYWSSTTSISSTDKAIQIQFNSGDGALIEDAKNNGHFVRCVRGGGNSIPIADAGSDQNVLKGSTVAHDGSGSRDGNGDSLTYSWSITSKPSGSTAVLSDSTVVDPTFTADLSGSYEISLTVKDGKDESSEDSVAIVAVEQVPLPDTGQTISYTATFGEDADYSINPLSYTDNADGTITDNVTGLLWQKVSDGTSRSFSDASTYCENLGLPSTSSWRLPKINELLGIVHYENGAPTVDTGFFTVQTDKYFWADSSVPTNSLYIAGFDCGCTGHGDNSTGVYYSLCVSGDESHPKFSDNGDEAVADVTTQLIWQKTDGGSSNWEGAISYCESLSLADKNDWRLPNIKELTSIADATTGYEMDPSFFDGNLTEIYWSSTTETVADTSTAWIRAFNDFGMISPLSKTESHYIRCVRDGQ